MFRDEVAFHIISLFLRFAISEYQSGSFYYEGNVLFSVKSTFLLSEVNVKSDDEMTFCTLQCISNIQCRTVDICANNGVKVCRLYPCRGVDSDYTNDNINICKRYQLDIYKDNSEAPVDCWDIYKRGNRKSGVYRIFPYGFVGQPVSVICDMDLEPYGWTIIQNRKDGSVSFDKLWEDYKYGFGTACTEYWIGNEAMNLLTTSNKTNLHISITLANGTEHFILYEDFSISDESDLYRLSLGPKINGTLDDRIRLNDSYGINGKEFQTKDVKGEHECTTMHNAGWWFNHCHDVFLNGQYGSSSWEKPWAPFINTGEDIKKTRMSMGRQI